MKLQKKTKMLKTISLKFILLLKVTIDIKKNTIGRSVSSFYDSHFIFFNYNTRAKIVYGDN